MSVGGRDRDRAMVIKKTGGPVQFEITEQTHDAIDEWLAALTAGRDQYLFEPIPGTAADLDTPVRAHRQGDFGLCRGTAATVEIATGSIAAGIPVRHPPPGVGKISRIITSPACPAKCRASRR